jgi:hypothetical protein
MRNSAHREKLQPFVRRGEGGVRPQSDFVGTWLSKRSGIWRRVLAAIGGSCQLRVDREIADIIAHSGGRMTDEIERQIGERMTGSCWGGR